MKIMSKTLVIFCLLLLAISGCVKQNTPQVTEEATATQAIVATNTPASLRQQLNIPQGDLISEIQGAGHRSPIAGFDVSNVFGIVTAKRGDGFYMQDPEGDGNPATSEGIVVIIRGFPKMNPGDAILVKTGVVKEFNPGGDGSTSLTITQVHTSDYEILGSGYPLPEATIIGEGGRIPPVSVIDDDVRGSVATSGSFDHETDGIDFYESMESMLIQVNDAIAVSATSGYKEIAIVGDKGKNAVLLTARGGILAQEGDFNPERIILDDGLRNLPKVEVGDHFGEPIVGVLDYTFGNFKLQTTQKLEVIPGNLEPEKSQLVAGDNQISVATYNLENLDALDDPSRLTLLADHIVNALNSPDIIGVQEVMDNDGEMDSLDISADISYQTIIDAVLKIGGPEYRFMNIDPLRNADGGAPGGNIRVGFLYRTDRGLTPAVAAPGDARTAVEIVEQGGLVSLSLNPGRLDPQNRSFIDSRKPLVAQFNYNNKTLFVVVCHLNSKGGDDPLFGGFMPPYEVSAEQRSGQARAINKFVSELITAQPESLVVVMGDMNDFPWSDSIKALQKDILVNLVTTLPKNEQYTYIFEGNSQVLDQIFVSETLMGRLVEVDVVHVNSEYYYQDRLSDHDPVLALFDLN